MTGLSSPVRFQLVVAAVAVSGAVAVNETRAPEPDSQTLFTFQDREIDESSGLVEAGGTVLTVNDSGGRPVVYVVDAADGRTVGRTTYTEDEVLDVEALAPGPGDAVWVGDIGDNRWSRSSVAVYELSTPTPGDATVDAQRYDIVYQGGPRDAEALLVHPVTGRLYVVSKGLFGGQLFEGPRELSAERANVFRPVADAGGMVTDGAFFPDGRFLALRSYSNLTVLETDGWGKVQGMPLPDQYQGEGLAMTPSGRTVLVSTEGAGSDVLEVPLTREIRERVAESARPDRSDPAESARPDGSEPAESARSDASVPWRPVAGGVAVLALVGAVLLGVRRRRA